MTDKWLLGFVLVSVVFLGCQSITGQVVQNFEEKSRQITGDTLVQSVALTLEDITLGNGMLQTVELRVQNSRKKDLQFHVKILQDDIIVNKEFSFKGTDTELYSLPMDTKLKTGRYFLSIEVLSAGEKLTAYSQYFRMNLWNQF